MTRPLTPSDLFQVYQWSGVGISWHLARHTWPGSPRLVEDAELPRLLATNAAIGCAYNLLTGELERAEDHLRDLRRHLKKVKEDKAAQASQN
jgi:hypothetical protein